MMELPRGHCGSGHDPYNEDATFGILRSGRHSMSSKTDKRAKEILRLLLSHGKTSVDELTRLFATSPASVRRDLMRLEERGLVHRTHGGAMLAGHVYEPFRFDASFQVREQRFAPEKRRIAMAAADLV